MQAFADRAALNETIQTGYVDEHHTASAACVELQPLSVSNTVQT